MRHILRALAALCGVAACVGATAATQTVSAADLEHVKWVGRTQVAGAAVGFDWEGVAATVALSKFTWVTVDIVDECGGTAVGGGSRWSVQMTPSDTATTAAGHRIATFYSMAAVRTYVLFNLPGGQCDPACGFPGVTLFTLTRLTESRLSGCSTSGNLTVLSFSSDGVFEAAPPASPRRLEFIGDSITAGDLNDVGGGDTQCANAAFNDDVLLSTGGQLCFALGADCMYTAWGGGTVDTLTALYPYTFSGSGAGYGNWDGKAFGAAGVVINLGTNDRPAPPGLAWQAKYTNLVNMVLHAYGDPKLVVFLVYSGPMTSVYAPEVLNVTAQLKSSGVNVVGLNMTLAHAMTGCYGHPSAADNAEIAALVQPTIVQALNW